MMPEAPSSPSTSKGTSAAMPTWFAPWATRVAELYFSRTTSVFILHGNVFDVVRSEGVGGAHYGTLTEFLAEQLFGTWGLVLHYDLAGGLRVIAGRNEERLKEMVPLAHRKVADLSALARDPGTTMAVLDRFVRQSILGREQDRVSAAVLFDHASHLVPAGEPGRLNLQASTCLVTLANWAASPHVKQMNMAFVLMDENLSALNERLTANPHVASIEIALPDATERQRFVETTAGENLARVSDYAVPELAQLTAGMSLTDLNVLTQSALETNRRLDATVFKQLKKRLIERQAHGLIEFIEPKWSLDTVIGHEAAKSRLREDATLLKRGALESLPMGYLICGPVGTGKSFFAQCAASEVGAPCVILKNFRSKYVGETEGNLERVLSVLRAMGPVVVVVDEADAALGDRDTEGDSGTSSRVFGMIATQMGDTRYRGRIIWMLLTARPDLLPIDIKRQGRAEVHIPLFYPTEETEMRDMFLVLARKLGTTLAAEDIPPIPQRGNLSGADIEGLVGRALRRSLLTGYDRITRESLAEVIGQFMPSTQGLERELQETAALLECTDSQFLPAALLARIERDGGRANLQERLTALKRFVEAL